MGRLYLLREGFTHEDDILPARAYMPVSEGPIAGKAMTPQMLSDAMQMYFAMMGWDKAGAPGLATLEKLGLEAG
jgi:aldehyde:ferredoxin oxidoreductase